MHTVAALLMLFCIEQEIYFNHPSRSVSQKNFFKKGLKFVLKVVKVNILFFAIWPNTHKNIILYIQMYCVFYEGWAILTGRLYPTFSMKY